MPHPSFWQKLRSKIVSIATGISKPVTVFYTLPWLMFLIVAGTIAQKEMGLYAATEKYFNSFILWLGPIPLPGALTTIGFILIALTFKFLFFSQWKWEKAGTHLTHLGVLLLLLGGILTSAFAREGFMVIPEGRNINAVSDYRERVLVFKGSEQGIQKTIPFAEIKNGNRITHEGIEFQILEVCDNCSARAPSGKYDDLQGLAQNMELFPIADEKNIEANFSGLIFNLTKSKENKDLGTYIVMEDIQRNPIIDGLEIKLERAKEILPFSITLNDFRKIDYAGTNKARKYESDLTIEDNNISWPTTISMNEPMRYKGYTFYQSSFEQTPEIEVTVLNVVHNVGRIFPYISTLIIFVGLLLHFIIRIQTINKGRNA